MSKPPADATDGLPPATPRIEIPSLPLLPLLPPPDVVARVLRALPADGHRARVDGALRAFVEAIAARWAGERYARAQVRPRDRAEAGAVHIFRMVDSGWRFARDPDAIRSLRRTLMADGVGRELYRDWPLVLSWMRALVAALQTPAAAAARARHLGRMLEFFVEEVDAAAAVSPPLALGGDGPVLAAGRALQAALVDALAAFAEAGGDLDRLVVAVRADGEPASRADHPPVEPDEARPPPGSDPPTEVEEADE